MMEQSPQGNQPPQGPVAPDDLVNYQRTGMFGQIVNMLKSGWNHNALFKQSVRVGSGTALASNDGMDGYIMADGVNAGLFFADRAAPRTAVAAWYMSTSIHLYSTLGITLWTIDPTTGQLAQPAWTAPTLTNSWANVAGYSTAGYYLDIFGFINLKGTINTGAASTSAFTLPAGMRPAAIKTFPAARLVGGVWGSDAVEVQSGGGVFPIQAGGGVNNGYSLEGIRFDTR